MEFKKNREYGFESTGVYMMRFGEKSKWYNIHVNNIVFHGPVELRRQFLNCALQGVVCRVKAVYSRAERKLKIDLEKNGGD